MFARALLHIANIFFENRSVRRTIPDTESTPAPLGASDPPIPAEIGFWEAECALSPPGSGGGVAAHTRHRGAPPDRDYTILYSHLTCDLTWLS